MSHLLFVACSQEPAPPVQRDAHPMTASLPQTPDEAWADYLAASPQPMVAERDGDGRPLLYYGRVFARSDVELRSLDVLWFLHDARPFFDEYDAAPGQSGGDYSRGNWEYAVATGAQWNTLIRYPGIVSAVQLNPKLATVAPHPMMDQLTDASGALKLEAVAKLGLLLPSPPALPLTCNGVFASLLDDFLNALEGALSAAAGWIVDTVKALGGAIDDELQRIYDGVSDALDELRKLGNDGVCAAAGSRAHGGIVYLYDAHIEAAFNAPFAHHEEPFRRVSLRARGGPGGILLTTARAGIDGRYAFSDLCGTLDYTLAMELSAPWAWLTHDGFSAFQVDLGTVHAGDADITWTVHDSPEAEWLMGLQLGWQNAVSRFGLVPKQAKVVAGFFTDSILGKVNGGVSTTSCGELELVAVLLPIVELAGNLFNGDIYMSSAAAHLDGNDVRSGPGVAAHEYGHHAMCEAVRQLGGDLDGFLNHYVITLLATLRGGDPLVDPLRNTLEAVADYTSYLTMGYTDYFQSDFNGLNVCGSYAEPRLACLENDSGFPLSSDGHAMVASRASVLYDWVARAVDPTAAGGDHLALAPDVVPRASARVGAQIVSDNLTEFVAQGDASADALCRVYRDHGWSCDNLSQLPVTLEAPGGFAGVASAPGAITWSWAPTSPLAQSYALVNAAGAGWVDVQVVGPDVSQVTQAILGAGGNQRVIAAVESRRPGAMSARSVRIARCTLATPASAVTVSAGATGIALTWPAGDATDFAVSRADENGSFVPLAVVAATSFVDSGAGPGVQYRYRVAARNCDGVESAAAEVTATRGVDEPALFFVDAAAPAGGDGSRAHPFTAIGDALAAVTPARRTLALAGGVYRERLQVTLDGVSLFGGYSAGFAARDPDAHPTIVIGDGTSWTINRDAFGDPMAPLVEALGSPLSIDGVDFSPGSLLCFGGCLRMGLAYAAGEIDLVRVHYQGADGIDLPAANDYTALFCKTCNVADSTLIEPPSSAGKTVSAIHGGAVTVTGSILAGGLFGDNVTVGGSVVRGNESAWSGAALSAGCAQISSSIVGGTLALTATNCRSALVGSAFYGPASVRACQLIDDIFIADSSIPLDIADAGDVLTGMVVRNNLFVPLAGQGLATTSPRAGQGPLPASSVNDASAWFASGANDVAQNQVAGSLDALFADTAPSPAARVLHPLPGAPQIGAGVDPSSYGYPLPFDLDGNPRTVIDIGPY